MTRPLHEWDDAYQQPDPAPWDIGRPQPAFIDLADQGQLDGDVLDAGCGTGEHALFLAARGARVTGVDASEVAVARARDKAAERGLTATFDSGDILAMPLPRASFDVVVDSGLFHVFSDEDRPRYVAVLRDVLRPGGVCHLMCFCDRQPGDWGPRRVTRGEIEAAFADHWVIDRLEAAEFELNRLAENRTAQAWLAKIRKV